MKFDQYIGKANEFLKEVARELGTPEDTDHAYRIMSSVFHTVREVLSPEESLHLISQLPMFLKAVYVNGWHLKPKDRIRSMHEFIECSKMYVRLCRIFLTKLQQNRKRKLCYT